MNTLKVNLTITEWGSKHSDKVFKEWQKIDIPKPAKQFLPEWHKKTTPLDTNNDRTIKRCMPVTDVLTLGYILPCPVDVRVYKDSDDCLKFDDDDGEFFVTRHSPTQYENTHFSNNTVLKFDFPWVINTPPGYSILYTQPVYRDNSRLEALPALVSTDTYYNSSSCPVIVKDWNPGEVLEIPRGYPLIQAIPLLREDWEMKTDYADFGELIKTAVELTNNTSAYRDKFRHKRRDV